MGDGGEDDLQRIWIKPNTGGEVVRVQGVEHDLRRMRLVALEGVLRDAKPLCRSMH